MQDSRPRASTPRHKNRLIVGSFLALVVLTALAFTVTGAGYFAVEQAKGESVEGEVTDYRIDESASPAEIVVDVEIANPTMRPVEIDSANFDGVVNGTSVARASTSLDATIAAGETKTVTLRLIPRDDHHSTAIEAAESGSLSVAGTMWARIERLRFTIDVVTESSGGESA